MKVLEREIDGTRVSLSNVIIGQGELWPSYSDLVEVIQAVLKDTNPKAVDDLSQILKQYKPDFIHLLGGKARNLGDREELRKAGTEGAFFKGYDHKTVLPIQLINETLLLSDIFGLNEYVALDLMATAEGDLERFPGWGRGIVAVFMYFDARHSLVHSVMNIVQVTPGHTWNSKLPAHILNMFKNCTEAMYSEDFIDRLVVILETSVLAPQLELLEANLALGDWRHRTEVTRLMRSTREGIARILFCFAAQRTLTWKETTRILDFLRKSVASREEGTLEREEIYLLIAISYAIHNHFTMSQVDQRFVTELRRYLQEPGEESVPAHPGHFMDRAIMSIVRLFYIVEVAHLSSVSHIKSLQNEDTAGWLGELLDEDMDFRGDVFSSLSACLSANITLLSEDPHLFHRLHEVFSAFVMHMPMKVKEFKFRSEESAKMALMYSDQGLFRPANLSHEYESMLECFANVYYQDSEGLAAEYFSNDPVHASLNKLTRSACIDSPSLFISNCRFLRGLAHGFPNGVLDLVREDGHSLSLDHFFTSMLNYLNDIGVPQNYVDTVSAFQHMDGGKFAINPTEIARICAYISLLETVCEQSQLAQEYFTITKVHWFKVALSVAKHRAFPREIRAKMLSALAAMIPVHETSQEVIQALWELLYASKLVEEPTAIGTLHHLHGDLVLDLEEIETPLESYSLTIGFLKLLKNMVVMRFPPNVPLDVGLNSESRKLDNGAFEKYTVYLVNRVFLKLQYRSYKEARERWTLTTLCMSLLASLLDAVPTLMNELLSDSTLLRTCFNVLLDAARSRELCSGYGRPIVDSCNGECLILLHRLLQRQADFLCSRDRYFSVGSVIMGLHELLLKMTPETGRPDYALAVLKSIETLVPEEQRLLAIQIVTKVVSMHSGADLNMFNALKSETVLTANIRQTLMNILYDVGCREELRRSVLKLLRVSVVHPSPNVAFLLLHLDAKVDFQNPGVQDYPRTLFHAVLDVAFSVPDSFLTLLVFLKDDRLRGPLLRYLRMNQTLKNFLTDARLTELSTDSIGRLLKCVAIEVKESQLVNTLVPILVAEETGTLFKVLNHVDLVTSEMNLPPLEFFDSNLILEVMKSCEEFHRDFRTKLVSVDALDSILRKEILKLEYSTGVRMQKTIQLEAQEIVAFAGRLNAIRLKEASKLITLEGWRQCVEVVVLSPVHLKTTGLEFVSTCIRMLLEKIVPKPNVPVCFRRLASETILTLSAVLHECGRNTTSPATVRVILQQVCTWVGNEESHVIRAILYPSILYLLKVSDKDSDNNTVLIPVVEVLCRDACHSRDVGRIQALNLLAEISSLAYIRESSVSSPSTSSSPSFSRTSALIHRSGAPGLLSTTFADKSDNSHIISFMLSKGFLKNLVDAISLSDNSELIALFTKSDPINDIRTLVTFEAKMNLLTRFAGAGANSTSALLDLNITKSILDMTMFQASFQDTIFKPVCRPFHEGLNSSTTLNDVERPVSPHLEAVLVSILKLYNVMVCTTTRNQRLEKEMWNFLEVYDEVLAQILTKTNLEMEEENLAIVLLASLIAHLKQSTAITPPSYISRSRVLKRLMQTLNLQSTQPKTSPWRIVLLRSICVFLYKDCRIVREHRGIGMDRLFLAPTFEYAPGPGQVESPSVGSLMSMLQRTTEVMTPEVSTFSKTLRDLIILREIGVSILLNYVDTLLTGPKVNTYAIRDEKVKLQKYLGPLFESRFVSLNSKDEQVTTHNEFMKTITLRLRRMTTTLNE